MLKAVLLLCTFASLHCSTKFWKYSNNVLNPINWERMIETGSGKDAGVFFPRELLSIASVFQLKTSQLVLPEDGEIEIRNNGFIEIAPNANTSMHLKDLKPHRWLHPDNWKRETQNAAIPDAEKVPCAYDDVVFDKDGTVAVVLPETSLSINSIQLEGVGLNGPQWSNYLETDYGSQQFFMSDYGETKVSVTGRICEKSSACSCHDSEAVISWICTDVKKDDPPCYTPVKPIGHCNELCGGIVKLEVEPGFRYDDVALRNHRNDEVDSYASTVFENGKHVIQIVFAEKKEYREISTKAAEKFYKEILGDLKDLKIKTARLEMAGIYLPKGSVAGTVFSIIFGTLIGATIVFGLLYFKYMGPLRDYNLRTPFSDVLAGNFSPQLFAKFDNKQEGSLSVAPSMVNLESSFDNPMYGSEEPVAEITTDIIVMTDTGATGSSTGTELENPLYNEKFEKPENEDDKIEDIKDVV